jgi:hypothetical protein
MSISGIGASSSESAPPSVSKGTKSCRLAWVEYVEDDAWGCSVGGLCRKEPFFFSSSMESVAARALPVKEV